MKKAYLLVTMDYNNKQALVSFKSEKTMYKVSSLLENMVDYTVLLTEPYCGLTDVCKEKELIEELGDIDCIDYEGNVITLFNKLYEMLN
jgi:hypothetical protein